MQSKVVEIQSACNFLIHLIKNDIFNAENVGFALEKILKRRYRNFWFPDQPLKGSGYRCIKVTSDRLDPLIIQAGMAVGVAVEAIRKRLPTPLYLSINPGLVTYTVHEQEHILYLDCCPNLSWQPSNYLCLQSPQEYLSSPLTPEEVYHKKHM